MNWLIDTLFVTGVLIALVLVLRGPVSRMFGPGMAYALWSLPLLRLILPPLVLPSPETPGEATVVPVFADEAPVLVHDAATAPAWSSVAVLTEVLQAVWLAGVIAFLVWRAWGYRSMRRHLLAEARPVGEIGDVRLVETPATQAPMAFGLRDKVIALPVGFIDSHDLAARDLAIAHELAHHTGHDLAVNFAAQPLLALHWFNPLAWIGWLALRRDQEAACDARVLAGRDRRARAAYGRLIAGFAHSPRMALAAPMACPVLGDKSIIERLRSLTMPEPSPRRRIIGRSLIVAGALALPLTATITYAASDTPDAPEAPEPPAAPDAPVAPEAPRAPDAPAAPDLSHARHITIIERDGKGRKGDTALRTRIINRNGQTIVFKSDKDLSEAEIEARIAKAEASLPTAEMLAIELPEPPNVVVDVDGEAIARDVRRSLARTVVVDRSHPVKHGTLAVAAVDTKDCGKGRQPVVAQADASSGDYRQVVKVAICDEKIARAQALAGIRKARVSIEGNSHMPDEVKRDVLRQLDREIDRLSKDG